MNKNIPKILNYLNLIVLGLYVSYLYLIEKLTLLIHPRYIWLVLVAGAIVCLIGLVGLIQLISESLKKKKENNKLDFKIALIPSLLLILTIGAFFIPVTSLSIFSYNIRSVKSELRLNDYEKKTLEQKFNITLNTRNFTIEDWVKARTLNNLKLFENKEFVGTGFVASKSDKTFNLSRFIISCCVVDATPVGLLVDTTNQIENKTEINDGEWLEVTGKFEIRLVNNESTPVIIPKTLKKTQQPKDTYINRN
jgi:putative membrane protein